jgi:hypothetical protein
MLCNFPLVVTANLIRGILRNTGFLFDVVVAACFHTKANLKAVFPRHQNNSGDKERLIYQKAPG